MYCITNMTLTFHPINAKTDQYYLIRFCMYFECFLASGSLLHIVDWVKYIHVRIGQQRELFCMGITITIMLLHW